MTTTRAHRAVGGLGRLRGLGVLVGTAALVAPLTMAVGAGTAQATSTASTACTAGTGPYQKQAERFLGRPVDGEQSPADCRAIRDFQLNHGVSPAIGWAGPVTWGVMDLVAKQRAAGGNPNAAGSCPTNKGRIACVDLTRQLSWVQDGARLKFGPVPVRSGRDGYETRTGLKRIYWRSVDHWSTIYKVRMPYSQFFDGGQAFHSIDGSVWSPPGSHGCVNMRRGDAKTYWSLLKNGDAVYVYGRKPGT